ncbi:acetylcholinesterase-like [Ornithodoros turicata]|uniref:acetylcholinesterase-like n=1 Tax=Ornithodoros turicata TaxID=34597 RepID=UPI003138D18D
MSSFLQTVLNLKCLIVLFLHCEGTAATSEVIISTSGGNIRGDVEEVHGRPIARFLGVPYAEPPIGALRFRPPEPSAPWQGVLDTRSFRASCAQYSGSPPPTPWLEDRRTFSEDCLFLNIWVPQDGVKPKAILIFVHGGAFRRGTPADELYVGNVLAAVGDIVVVTVAYRLGSFGFLHTGNDSSPGNYGLLDQEMAMQWMRTNAEVFGGDACAMTLYGQSVGAKSVGLQLLLQRNTGLIRRAIMSSGSPHWLGPVVIDDGRLKASTLAKAVGCEVHENDWIATVNCLREVPAQAIMEAENTSFYNERYVFIPTFGVFGLPSNIEAEDLISVDALLTGVNAEEGSSFINSADPKRFGCELPVNFTRTEAIAFAYRHFFEGSPDSVRAVIEAYFHGDEEGSKESLASLDGHKSF